MTKPNLESHDFVQEASGTYLQAPNAVREFRREIQARCLNIVQKRLPEIAMALDTSLNDSAACGWCNPDGLEKWHGVGASIGVQLKTRKGALLSYYALVWEQKPEKLLTYVDATLWVDSQKLAKGIYDRLGPVEGLDLGDREVLLWKEVPMDKVRCFDESLDHLIGEWCGLWRRAGGFEKVRESLQGLIAN